MTNPESTAIDPVAAMGTDHTEAPAHPLHKVLSFVRRSGRLDDRLQRAWDNYAGTYLLDIAAGNLLDVREGVTLDRAFVESAWGNDNPLIVEIGTGQGENVVAAAAAHPETNFLALEVYDPGVAHTLLLAGKQGLTNIRVAQVNAPELFKVTAAGTVAEVWTFFPDPWPKKKHHKRRIVQKAMAGDIHRALVTDGVWRIATDIEDYALHVHEVMDGLDGWKNLGSVTVSLPLEHVGKGNADMAAQLRPRLDALKCSGVLLDFQRPGYEEAELLAGRLSEALPCPVGVSALYGRGLTCPVFLPPVPPDVNLADYLAPWQGREIWLELALDGETITLTPSGAITASLPPAAQLLGGHRDEKLHCHYQIHTDADSARFTLFRTPEDLDTLLTEGEALGVTRAVGLYQELHGILPFLTDPE